jgi:hypothetical protein
MTHALFNCCLAVFGLGAIQLASAQRMFAQQDISSLEAVLRSGICPANTQRNRYDEITPREYGCKTICVNPSRNGGDCGPNGLVGYEAQCQAEVRKKNETIRRYNQFMSKCSSKQAPPSQKASAPSPSSSKQSGTPPSSKASPWAAKAKETERRAAKADEVNRQNAASANQQARNEWVRLEEDHRRQRERQNQIARDEAVTRNQQPRALPADVRLRHLANRCASNLINDPAEQLRGYQVRIDRYLMGDRSWNWYLYDQLCRRCQTWVPDACVELEAATGLNASNSRR